MRRTLSTYIETDLEKKIVLLSGPRQAGKTYLSRTLFSRFDYLNYDSEDDRKAILSQTWDRSAELLIFDEIHKMKKWKSWLKGVYDTKGVLPRLLVTGSARMDTFRKAGDSMAGRHFTYRLHPLTLKEIAETGNETKLKPEQALDRILITGPFPEPFLTDDENFARRWRKTHLDVVLRQDMLDLEKIRDLKSIEVMVGLLRERVGSTVSYSSLARDLQVSVPTIKHWLEILENLYVIFRVTPYHKNVTRSLLKDSKYYFYDTAAVRGDNGAKLENAVACALLRELHFLEDTRGFRCALHFMRDRDEREVDFVSLVDGKPTHLIEVKWADTSFAPNLHHFLKFLPGAKAWQVVKKLDRRRSTAEVQMIDAASFLTGLEVT